MSIPVPIELWRCPQHGLIEMPRSAARGLSQCVHPLCHFQLSGPESYVRESSMTPMVREAMNKGRAQTLADLRGHTAHGNRAGRS